MSVRSGVLIDVVDMMLDTCAHINYAIIHTFLGKKEQGCIFVNFFKFVNFEDLFFFSSQGIQINFRK